MRRKTLSISPPIDLRKSAVSSYRLALSYCWLRKPAPRGPCSSPGELAAQAPSPASAPPNSSPTSSPPLLLSPSSVPPHLLPVERAFYSPSSCAPTSGELALYRQPLDYGERRPCSSRRGSFAPHLSALPPPASALGASNCLATTPLWPSSTVAVLWRDGQGGVGHGTVIFLLVLMLFIVVNILMISCKDSFWNRNYFLLK
jgi:hypothetical protein